MMNPKNPVQQELALIDSGIKQLFYKNNVVIEDIESFVQGGSKRIRSVVALLYLKMQNIEISDDIVKVLVSGELIHNASLLHDDVVDNSELRRGKQNLYGKYGAKISILSGDYLLSIAVKNMLDINNKEILTLFVNTAENMSQAEIYQFLKRGNDITIEDYKKIIYGKTASLFETILESCAILSSLNREKAKKFGKHFGVLFQINNDMQEESAKNDIKNGLKTVKNILGLENVQIFKDNYKKELREILKDTVQNPYKTALEDIVKNI